MSSSQPHRKTQDSWLREWPLALTIGTFILLLTNHGAMTAACEKPVLLVGLLLAICAVLMTAAMSIVRHADVLAHRLGEPGGTLLLTLTITGLEVCMVGFVMSSGAPKPMFARDTMYAEVMLVLNGVMGLSLLLGAIKHGEQSYNLQSANSFLVLLLPLSVLGLVMPNYTRATPGPTLSVFQMVFLSIVSIAIYAVFLYVQIARHREYFVMSKESEDTDSNAAHESSHSNARHIVLLALYSVPLILLAEEMAKPLDAAVLKLGAPPALGGLLMAVLVLTPESVSAIRAALANRLQRSVNLLLGSVLASIGLTIPLVIAVSLYSGRELLLGLDVSDSIMLALSLVTSILTFSLPRTNLLLGAVHLLLFCVFLMLMFD